MFVKEDITALLRLWIWINCQKVHWTLWLWAKLFNEPEQINRDVVAYRAPCHSRLKVLKTWKCFSPRILRLTICSVVRLPSRKPDCSSAWGWMESTEDYQHYLVWIADETDFSMVCWKLPFFGSAIVEEVGHLLWHQFQFFLLLEVVLLVCYQVSTTFLSAVSWWLLQSLHEGLDSRPYLK